MSRTLRFAVVLAFAVFCFAVTPALAHHYHGLSFDPTKKITLSGTVTRMEFRNPHIRFDIDVEDENGKIASWSVQGSPLNVAFRRGWRADDMQPGDRVTVTDANMSRDGSMRIDGGTVTFADGREVLSGTATDYAGSGND